MRGLFARQTFTGFGPNGLLPSAEQPLYCVRANRPSRLRDRLRQSCPRLPGVYGMVDAAGELIYVGKAKCLRGRLLSYFRPASRDPKAGRVVAETRAVAWEPAPSEFAALLRELELIRRWQPRHNVQGQPRRRRRVYVCLGRRPAPHAFLTARPPRGAHVWGPVPDGPRAREAARRLNDLFGLRDCPQPQVMVFADQRELFPLARAAGCIRHEIGTCAGPCAAACTKADYAQRVRAARRFLDGDDAAPLELLRRLRDAAAEALEFERAATLHHKLLVLTWLDACLARLRQAAAQSFIYPVTGHDGSEVWYLIHRGCVRAALPASADHADREAASRRTFAAYRAGAIPPGPPAADEVDGLLLVTGWFRRRPAELLRVWRWDDAAGAVAPGRGADGT